MRTTEVFYDDYEIGATRVTTGRTITEADIVLHAGQTGDFFPHHMDEAWAQANGLGGRIAHGTLVMSVAIGMTATDINPRAMSYGYDRVRFVRAVHIGDTITAAARIDAKRDHPRRPEAGFVDETVTVTNQHGDVVFSCVHLYLAEKRATAGSRHG